MKMWWAARVMTGEEYAIKKAIRDNLGENCEIYIPRTLVTGIEKGEIAQKTESMLPGYVLIGTKKVINTGKLDYFITILGRVTEREVKHLREQEYKEVEDFSIEPGQKIIVNEGPFIGCKGYTVSQEGNKVKCKLHFQGIDIDADMEAEFLNTI